MSDTDKYRASLEVDAAELAVMTGGRLVNLSEGRVKIGGISTDSRKIKKGDAFLAIVGEKFDGHDFVKEAFEKGASLCIVNRKTADLPELVVGDTVAALGSLAKKVRENFKGKVVAITGSNGKTTTRNMIYSILSRAGKTVKSEGNFNNEIGLPMTLLKIPKDASFAVVELGMNHEGEIKKLAGMAMPDVGLITNIGPVHLEYLEDVEGVARAKGELFESMGRDSVAVVNLDDKMVVGQSKRIRGKRFTYSLLDRSADLFSEFREIGVEGLELKFRTKGEGFGARIVLPGRHNAVNATAAAAVAMALGIPEKTISLGLAGAEAEEKRFEVIRLRNGVILVNDCYNANPVSTEAALKTASGMSEDRHFVFGDMLELGKQAPSLHETIGKLAGRLGFGRLYLLGEHADSVRRGALSEGVESGHAKVFRGHDEIFEELKQALRKGAVVLIKGSRGMRMEGVTERLLKEYGRD